MGFRKMTALVGSALAALTILYYVEQVARWSYFMTTPLKLCIFLGLPYIARRLFAVSDEEKPLPTKSAKVSALKLGAGLGLASAMIILVAYLVLSRWIDMAAIAEELIQKSDITPLNFVGIGCYIIFINSFIEEYFFRGFIFLRLADLGYRKLAYVLSALLFSLYHISIFATWFAPVLMGVALLGLFVVGLVFASIDAKSHSLYPSWVMHGIADAAIIGIGMRMFGLI